MLRIHAKTQGRTHTATSIGRLGLLLALCGAVMVPAGSNPAIAQDRNNNGIANAETGRAAAADRVSEELSALDCSGIRAAYEAHRHAAFAVEGGYEARNPGQQWLTRFDGRGFLTTPDAGGWSWGLELVSYGRPGAEQVVTPPSCVEADGGRVCYQWNDTLTEWYVNDRRGLEHGYTIHQRPDLFGQRLDRLEKSPDCQGRVGSRSRGPIHLQGNRSLTVAALNDTRSNGAHECGRCRLTGGTPVPPLEVSALELTLAVRGGLRPRVSADASGLATGDLSNEPASHLV